MTATPAKMTVKTRTPTPARRDFRSRVICQVCHCGESFGLLAQRKNLACGEREKFTYGVGVGRGKKTGAFDGVGVVGLMHRVRPVPGDM